MKDIYNSLEILVAFILIAIAFSPLLLLYAINLAYHRLPRFFRVWLNKQKNKKGQT